VAVAGVSVNVLPGSVRGRSVFTLDITRQQFPSTAAIGFATSPNGILLTLDATTLTNTPEFEIRLPFEGAADRSTVIWAADPSDYLWPLMTYRSEDGTRLVGRLPAAFFQRGSERSAIEQKEYSIRIFSLTRSASAVASPFTASAMMFNRATGEWGPISPGFNPRGKRLALLVHGLMGSLADFAALAPRLASLNGGGIPFYDCIIGFQYSSTAPLAEIGDAMVAMVAPNIASAASVDLIAHSMGNLVSRWAMEQGSEGLTLGGVTRYLSLGGPHDGVPFGSKYFYEFLQLAEYIYPGCEPCLLDLLTDGYQGEPSRFLAALDDGSPNPNGTRYYSLAGDDWFDYSLSVDGYTIPVGLITFPWYVAVCGATNASEDGLVAAWSAQPYVLSKKDPFWKPSPVVHATHHGLLADQTAIERIVAIIRKWQLSGEVMADVEMIGSSGLF
jgi:pimeloyl-ACP methyl ester carboxylesterase